MSSPARVITSFTVLSNKEVYSMLRHFLTMLARCNAPTPDASLRESHAEQRVDTLDKLDRLRTEVAYRAEDTAAAEQAPAGSGDAITNDILKEIVRDNGDFWYSAGCFAALAHVIAESRAAQALVVNLDGAGLLLYDEEKAQLRQMLRVA